jgi:4-hydroxybenzoate polyprenyltransferase|tara:strand:- start:961 stop:1914 length:954 start_codon:yes stop_codon:yes gene_type:complete
MNSDHTESDLMADRNSLAVVVKLLRPHQWVKNLLVFLAPILGQKIGNSEIALTGVWAFFSLSFVASAVYVLNDRMDLQSDRLHPTKCRRPFASGAVSPRLAPFIIIGMLAAGFGMAYFLVGDLSYCYALASYFAVTTLYTFWLKRIVMVDALVLGGLFTLRIVMGSVATGVVSSVWLLAFSMFVFTSIAFGKRFSELFKYQDVPADDKRLASLRRRGYQPSDILLVEMFGICTGVMAVMVMALYMNDEAAAQLYVYPQALWGVVLAVFYWVCNFWMMAHRGKVAEDAVKYIVLDRSSWISATIVVVCMLIAIWPFSG